MLRVLAAAAALALLAGCGEKRINSGDLEAKLRTQLGKSGEVDAKSADCPDEVKVEKGTKFDCTVVTPDGDRVTVKVMLTDDKGGLVATVPPRRGG